MLKTLTAAALGATAAFSLLTAAPALAETVYECNFPQLGANGGWVPEVVIASPQEGEGKAVVYDPIIEHFVGDPILAKIDTDNAKRLTLSWEVKAKAGTQNARIKYRLTVMKADNKASITSIPMGYANTFVAQGKCKKSKVK